MAICSILRRSVPNDKWVKMLKNTLKEEIVVSLSSTFSIEVVSKRRFKNKILGAHCTYIFFKFSLVASYVTRYIANLMFNSKYTSVL